MEIVRRPTLLSDHQVTEYKKQINELSKKVDSYTNELISDIECEAAEAPVKRFAFTPNKALPKRHSRPAYGMCYISENLHLSHGGENTEELLKFVIVMSEYYDIADDLFDGDVSEGYEAQVFITKELLQPILIERLTMLGADELSYWCDQTIRMIPSLIDELEKDVKKENYVKILNTQSKLFSIITGISAMLGEADEEEVRFAEEFGKLYFKYDQFILDWKQYNQNDADPWNAWEIMNEEEILYKIQDWQSQLNEYVSEREDNYINFLRPLVLLDISKWHDEQKKFYNE